MKSKTYRSYAKVNLHLQVLGRRDDGFHELLTVFQTVAHHDLINLSLKPQGVSIDVETADPHLMVGTDNLAWKAAAGYFESFGGCGVHIVLRKRIAVAAGLGGGSSNAATVLLGLRDLHGIPEEVGDLHPLAEELGSDVPFFLTGGTAVGRGRGERVTAAGPMEPVELLLARVPVPVSTAEVFEGLAEISKWPDASAKAPLSVPTGPFHLRELNGWNDLEPVVWRRYKAIGDVYNALVAAGAEPARLSGSGGTVFAAAGGSVSLEGLAQGLPASCAVIFTRSIDRDEIASNWIL